jgi:hypothetical protein
MEEKSAKFVQILWAAGELAAHVLVNRALDLSIAGRQIQQRHWVAVLAAQSTISCAQLLESDGNRRVMPCSQQVAELDHAATSRSKFLSIA